MFWLRSVGCSWYNFELNLVLTSNGNFRVVPVLHSVSDICLCYSDPQVTTPGEFRTGPLYVPTTFVVQMLKLRAVHIYRAHGNVTLNEYQLARFVYSVLLYAIALHIVFWTFKYDREPDNFMDFVHRMSWNLTHDISGKGSVSVSRLAFSKTKCCHVVTVYILITHELSQISEYSIFQ